MVTRRVYDQEKHVHFVTFSCDKRRQYLNPDRAKRIVIGTMGSELAKRNGLCSGFVIMPDHVHTLMWFPEVEQLSSFMDVWKTQTSRSLKNLYRSEFQNYWQHVPETDPIWQARYYGFNLWSRRKLEEKLAYRHQNPVRAGLVERCVDWPWSSARWYEERKSVGTSIKWPPGMELNDDFTAR